MSDFTDATMYRSMYDESVTKIKTQITNLVSRFYQPVMGLRLWKNM